MKRFFTLAILVVTALYACETARASVVVMPLLATTIDNLNIKGATSPHDKFPNLRKSFEYDGNLAAALNSNASSNSANPPASCFTAIAFAIAPISGSAASRLRVDIPPSPIDEFFRPPKTPVSCLF